MRNGLMKHAMAAALLIALGGLGACGNVSRSVAPDGSHADQLSWPSPDSVTPMHKGGTYPTVASLRGIAAGMNKQQIMARLGPPHFHEGVWGVREWNYLFNLHKPGTDEVVQCQYKILFDEQKLARSFYWQPASCADLLNDAPKDTGPTPPKEQTFTLSTDALFVFDKSDAADIKPDGREQLAKLAQQIADAGAKAAGIRVVGYTDRIGSDAYNQSLSQRRAETVMHYLEEHGVAADRISAEGRGKADPVVECNQRKRTELIDCLSPNRRVEVRVDQGGQ